MIFNSPFEYDVIETFVRVHEELVYSICSRTRSPRPWKQLYLIAFIDLIPVATEKVSHIRSNIICVELWKSTRRARSIRVNLNQGTEMSILCTLFIRPEGILEFVYDKRARDCKCLLIFESFLRIIFVKNIHLQISFYA